MTYILKEKLSITETRSEDLSEGDVFLHIGASGVNTYGPTGFYTDMGGDLLPMIDDAVDVVRTWTACVDYADIKEGTLFVFEGRPADDLHIRLFEDLCFSKCLGTVSSFPCGTRCNLVEQVT